MKNELKLVDVSHQYGSINVLENISITLRPGVYGLIGANGAGKTTLIKILTGTLKSTKGFVSFNNETIFSKDYRSIVGLMPQNQKGYDNFTGYQLLSYMATMKELNKDEYVENINQLIKMASMESFIHNKIKTYSGGMRQRLMLAQALLGNPQVVYLDEPTAGLDPGERINIRNYISQFAKDRIVIVATHVMQDIESIANEIILLKKGKIDYIGNISSILTSISKYVYEKEISVTEIDDYQSKYKISNIIQKDSKLIIKFISEDDLEENARLIQPTLDEVYLHYLV